MVILFSDSSQSKPRFPLLISFSVCFELLSRLLYCIVISMTKNANVFKVL